MRELLRGAPGSRGEAAPQVSLQAEAVHQPHADPLLHRARRHATLRQKPQLGPGTINDWANSTLTQTLQIRLVITLKNCPPGFAAVTVLTGHKVPDLEPVRKS